MSDPGKPMTLVPVGSALPRHAPAASLWLRRGVAFVWLWTGLAVFHPYYRELGAAYLEPLCLPPAVMYGTCAAEVLLGVRVALGRAATWLTALQVAGILAFTLILSVTQPALWLDESGVLTKNIPLIVMIVAAWLLERQSQCAGLVLLLGTSLFWVVSGVLGLIRRGDPLFESLLIVFGLALPYWRALTAKCACGSYVAALTGFTAFASWNNSLPWFHPFGPFTKNVSEAVALLVILRYFTWGRLVTDRPRLVA
jgi:hypothetical protein